METTRLSTKGQVVLPKAIRSARAWGPGTEFRVEETPQGILLQPLKRFPATTLEEVMGCLKWAGKPKSMAQMDRGIAREVKRRHAGGRY
jgi:AbrB family looped-hinge helix DNA binding protein